MCVDCLKDKIEQLTDELAEARTLIFELFAQATMNEEGLYDHGCISTYEEAQDYLLKHYLVLSDRSFVRK